MYEYTDKVIAFLNRRYMKIFRNLRRRLSSLDEITLIGAVQDTYREVDNITRETFLKLAKKTYKQHTDHPDIIGEMWVNKFLDIFSPFTKYVYTNEVERKAQRLYEGLMSTNKSPKEIETSLKQFSKMSAQYALELTDYTAVEAWKADGVKYVRWVSVEDLRTCEVCYNREGRIYPIDKIPPKPHWGCRCWYIPAAIGRR